MVARARACDPYRAKFRSRSSTLLVYLSVYSDLCIVVIENFGSTGSIESKKIIIFLINLLKADIVRVSCKKLDGFSKAIRVDGDSSA